MPEHMVSMGVYHSYPHMVRVDGIHRHLVVLALGRLVESVLGRLGLAMCVLVGMEVVVLEGLGHLHDLIDQNVKMLSATN